MILKKLVKQPEFSQIITLFKGSCVGMGGVALFHHMQRKYSLNLLFLLSSVNLL